MSHDLDDLLLTWESNYKKGLLSFWMLLVLREQPAYALELGDSSSRRAPEACRPMTIASIARSTASNNST